MTDRALVEIRRRPELVVAPKAWPGDVYRVRFVTRKGGTRIALVQVCGTAPDGDSPGAKADLIAKLRDCADGLETGRLR
ncbi:hypothetical protein HN937_18030 [Candidatus Poribacteria bacterium]|jgi:hypothetical protein|nr:hypothetical protein [Candidatus Poribacteria bacterium]